MPERGLYEVLITEALEARLRDLGERLEARRSDLRSAEAADRIALHLGRIIHRAVAAVGEDERVAVSIALARQIIAQIDSSIANADAVPDTPIDPATVLRAVAV